MRCLYCPVLWPLRLYLGLFSPFLAPQVLTSLFKPSELCWVSNCAFNMLPLLQPIMKYHKLISDASLEIWLSSSDFTEWFTLHSVQEMSMCKHRRGMCLPGLEDNSHLSSCSSLAGRTLGPLLKPLPLIWCLHFFIPTAATPGQMVMALYMTCNELLTSLLLCDLSLPNCFSLPFFTAASV